MQLVNEALLAARLVAAVLFPAAQAEIFENLAFLASGVVSETLPSCARSRVAKRSSSARR